MADAPPARSVSLSPRPTDDNDIFGETSINEPEPDASEKKLKRKYASNVCEILSPDIHPTKHKLAHLLGRLASHVGRKRSNVTKPVQYADIVSIVDSHVLI